MSDRNPLMKNATGHESADLARFAAGLSFDDIPEPVVDRTVDLFVTGPARRCRARVSGRLMLSSGSPHRWDLRTGRPRS